MNYNGHKIGFKRTVGAIAEMAKLAPGGDIGRMGEVFANGNLGETVENGAKFLAILNKWYEKSKVFEEPGYQPDPAPEEFFMLLDMEDYTDLINEAMETFNLDDQTTVEAVSKKNG